MATQLPDLTSYPDQHGHFGPYGGRFVPETLMTALLELEQEYELSLIHISEPTRPY